MTQAVTGAGDGVDKISGTITKGWNRFTKRFAATSRGIEIMKSAMVVFAVAAINFAAVVFGAGILYTAAVAGFVFILSVSFILASAGDKINSVVQTIMGKYGFALDAVLTCVLTVAGFTLGVYLGITAMFIGINMSAGINLMRIKHLLSTPEGEKMLIQKALAPDVD